MASPVRQRYHGRQHSHLNFWLCAYEGRTPGVEVGDNSTVRLDLDNMPQPDCLLFVQPEHGGRVRIDEDGYIEGAPDLVAEVAASSASFDLGNKLECLPPQRCSRVRRLAGARSADRLVRKSRARDSSCCCPMLTGSCAARCFPVSGSIRPPWCGAMSMRC